MTLPDAGSRLRELLETRSLSFVETLHDSPARVLHVVTDGGGRRLVLKIYKRPGRGILKEQQFLRRVSGRRFASIRFPALVDAGADFTLTEFVERRVFTSDVIASREWPEREIDLWVEGLLEFQNIPVPSGCFTLKERLGGVAYPAFRMATLVAENPRLIRPSALPAVLGLIASYLASRFFFRNVLTHYDLHTYNYTLTADGEQMSLLDFEMAYRGGDPLFDVLYYLTVPRAPIEEWTYQLSLLNGYLRRSRPDGRRPPGVPLRRIRLILLLCNGVRLVKFREDAARRLIHERNVHFLLDGKAFSRWASERLFR